MFNTVLAGFYERDLRKLIDEVNLFIDEENLWKTRGSVNNSSGNLVLHLIGGLSYHIGAVLGNTGYVRNRDTEFSHKNVLRKELVEGLEALIPVITGILNNLTNERMDARHPIFFDKENTTTGYVLTQLLIHLNYHLGQVNYLRRVLE